MTSHRWLAFPATVLLAAVALVAVHEIPAAAAPGDLEYSTNGTTWSATPPSAVFATAPVLVPGGSSSADVWIRSARSTPIVLGVYIGGVTVSDALFGTALSISSADPNGDGLPATAANAISGSCVEAIPQRQLDPGESVRVRVSVGLASSLVGQEAQSAVGGFSLQVQGSDFGPSTLPNGCPIDATLIPSTPGGLPSTGSDGAYPALVLAAISGGVGWLLLLIAARRARRRSALSSAPSA